jgi:hypothetical protein
LKTSNFLALVLSCFKICKKRRRKQINIWIDERSCISFVSFFVIYSIAHFLITFYPLLYLYSLKEKEGLKKRIQTHNYNSLINIHSHPHKLVFPLEMSMIIPKKIRWDIDNNCLQNIENKTIDFFIKKIESCGAREREICVWFSF